MHIYKDVEPLKEDRVHSEEVGSNQALGMHGNKLLPSQLRQSTGGWNSVCEQHRADRGRCDSVTDLQEFATDPEVAQPGFSRAIRRIS